MMKNKTLYDNTIKSKRLHQLFPVEIINSTIRQARVQARVQHKATTLLLYATLVPTFSSDEGSCLLFRPETIVVVVCFLQRYCAKFYSSSQFKLCRPNFQATLHAKIKNWKINIIFFQQACIPEKVAVGELMEIIQ